MQISVCHVRGHHDILDYESPLAPRRDEIIDIGEDMYRVCSVHHVIKDGKLDYVWVKVGDVY